MSEPNPGHIPSGVEAIVRGLGKLVRDMKKNLADLGQKDQVEFIDGRLRDLKLPVESEDTWPGLTINDVAYDDERKKYAIITNGRCRLPHATPAEFHVGHAGGGCQFTPFEGIVGTNTDGVWSWDGIQEITGWVLRKCSDTKSQEVRDAHKAAVEAADKK